MPENRGRSVDERLDEKDSVKFVDVVLVGDRPVEPAEAGGDARGQLRTAAVQQIREKPSEPGHPDGNHHEQILERALTGFRRGFLRNVTRSLKNGSQKGFEMISVSYESPKDRQHSKDHERTQHYPRALMWLAVPMAMTVIIVTMSILRRAAAVLAAECHVHQPEHIKGCNESSNHADQPIHPACVKGFPKNLVLGPEASERWNARDSKRGNPHRRKSPGHENPQPAHLSHVLLATDAVNHRTCRKEQQPLKERVRHQVEDARGERAHAAGHEHIAKLRDGGVG